MHPLSLDQQEQLLALARRAMAYYLKEGQRLEVEITDGDLLAPMAAFVSLHQRQPAGQLRGCIGTFETDTPLVDVVTRMSIAAATRDPRFPACTHDELDSLDIEISVLSPPVAATAGEVVVGQHGLLISRGSQRGVLLPQVATDHGWDAETFLAQTCRKAGLPAESWKAPETQIEVFTAQVFTEASSH